VCAHSRRDQRCVVVGVGVGAAIAARPASAVIAMPSAQVAAARRSP
jgi:hypothetical protein